MLAQDFAGDDDGARGERRGAARALEAVVAPVLLDLGLGDGRRLEAVRTEVDVHGGGDAVLATSHLAVAAEVEVGQRRLLRARARVEDPLLVVKREGHGASAYRV